MQDLGEGRHTLSTVLGSGGMATVYRGHDTRLDVPRAVKVLDPRFGGSTAVRTRFEHEARVLARLHHPNLVTVFNVGQDGGTLYLVMELVPGGSLQDRVERGALPARSTAATPPR